MTLFLHLHAPKGRLGARAVIHFDVFVVLRVLVEAPFLPARKLGFLGKVFSDFCFLRVVGASLPVGIESQRGPELYHGVVRISVVVRPLSDRGHFPGSRG